jgi:hypothetical protein
MRYCLMATLTAFAIVSTAIASEKGPTPVKPAAKFAGSVEDDKAEAPRQPILTSEKELAALWKAWKLTDRMPKVDFARQFVLVSTSIGSSLDVTLRRDDKGDLKVSLEESSDSPPGLRYVIQVIDRAGIKSVNGKKLP